MANSYVPILTRAAGYADALTVTHQDASRIAALQADAAALRDLAEKVQAYVEAYRAEGDSEASSALAVQRMVARCKVEDALLATLRGEGA